MTLDKSKKALFLDRDGIINIDHGYVFSKEMFDFSEGIFDLLHLFIKHNYILFIITNQSGIGRGYYTANDFEELTLWMLNKLEEEDIHIESVHHCPHALVVPCQCRKPATGMIDTILLEHNIDLENSWMIGDKQSDIDLAHNAHIKHTIAIGSRIIKNTEYHFNSITACKTFLEENQDTIL